MALREFNPGNVTARELKTIIRWDVMEDIGPHSVRPFRLRIEERPSDVNGGWACVAWSTISKSSPIMYVCRRALFLTSAAFDRLLRHEIIHLKRIMHGADFAKIAEGYATTHYSITRVETNEAHRQWKSWRTINRKGVLRKRRRKTRRPKNDGLARLRKLFPL